MAHSSYDENKDGACQVLKTDVLGRVKTGTQQREAMLDEFERSGLSGTKFAARCIHFCSWKAHAHKHPILLT